MLGGLRIAGLRKRGGRESAVELVLMFTALEADDAL